LAPGQQIEKEQLIDVVLEAAIRLCRIMMEESKEDNLIDF
jgi:hypothetical protein